MKKVFIIAGIILALSVIAIFLFYLFIAIDARAYTKKVVLPEIKNSSYELTLDDFGADRIDMLLKIEDPLFYDHKGIDLRTPGAGVTTLTQSCVKKLYFKNFKPGMAKIEQTVIARFAFDRLVDKNDQLTWFVNNFYLGNYNEKHAEGFAEAAKLFYDKEFEELTDDEYLSLVAMIIAPATFNVKKNPALNKERVRRMKLVLDGVYQPIGLFDLFYGPMPEEVQSSLPPMSYFESYYN